MNFTSQSCLRRLMKLWRNLIDIFSHFRFNGAKNSLCIPNALRKTRFVTWILSSVLPVGLLLWVFGEIKISKYELKLFFGIRLFGSRHGVFTELNNKPDQRDLQRWFDADTYQLFFILPWNVEPHSQYRTSQYCSLVYSSRSNMVATARKRNRDRPGALGTTLLK